MLSSSAAWFMSHPRRSTVVWGALIVMSGLMVLHNVVLQSWGIGSFSSITE